MRKERDLVNSTLSDAINAAYLQYQVTKDDKSFNFMYKTLKKFSIGYVITNNSNNLFSSAEQFEDIFQDVVTKVFLTDVLIDLKKASVTTFFIAALSNKIKDMKKLKRNQNVRFDEDTDEDNISPKLAYFREFESYISYDDNIPDNTPKQLQTE